MKYSLFILLAFCLSALNLTAQIIETPEPPTEIMDVYTDVEKISLAAREEELDEGVFKEENKCGLKYNEKIVVNPIYDKIYIPYRGDGKLYYIRKDDKLGVINKYGEILIPCVHYSLSTIDQRKDWFDVATEENKHGIIDTKNNIVLPLEYSYLREEKFGITLHKDALLGLLDYSGKLLFEPTYERISTINDDHKTIILKKQDLYSLYNMTEGFIYKENIKNIYSLYPGFSKYFVLDKTKLKKFEEVSIFAICDTNDTYGVYNFKNSNTIIPYEYQSINQRDNNHFIVKKNGKYGLINIDNTVILDFEYDSLSFQNNEITDDLTTIVAKKGNKYGLIDFKGNMLTDYIYEEIVSVNNGCYRAKIETEKYHLIKANGNLLTENTFIHTGTFEFNRIPVFDKNGFDYLDTNGLKKAKIIKPHIGYDNISDLENDFIKCLKSKDDSLLWDFTLKIAPSNYTNEYLKNIGVRINDFPNYFENSEIITIDEVQKKYFENLKGFRDTYMKDTSVTIEFDLERNWGGTKKDKARNEREYNCFDFIFKIADSDISITLDKVYYIEGNYIIFSTLMNDYINQKYREYSRKRRRR
ncbi:MAG: WG repeat-containing protein [Flavobacteriales bacterium]|nr:WG repeat-containing protein [Flavobacteriales bacterium]